MPDQFVFSPNAVVEPYCGKQGVVHFSGSTGQQYLETTEVNIGGSGAFVQFELNAGCSGASSQFEVELHYADSDGSNGQLFSPLTASSSGPWQFVPMTACNPGGSSGTSCPSWMGFVPAFWSLSMSGSNSIASFGAVLLLGCLVVWLFGCFEFGPFSRAKPLSSSLSFHPSLT